MNPPITRTSILRGPCQIQFGPAPVVFYSKDDVIVQLNVKTQNIVSTALGLVDYRDDDVNATITFTPDGQVTAALLAALYPFLQAGIYPGTSVFGAADQALVVWTRDGYKHTFNNAAVTEQPQFIASSTKTAFGKVTFTALRSMGAQWSGANSLASVTQAAYPGDGTFTLANILTAPFAARWFTGTVPAGNFTVTEASPAVFTAAAHGLVAGDKVYISGCAVDTALNGTWFVVSPAANTFELSATSGGAAINNIVGADAGTFQRANTFDYFETESGFTIDAKATLEGEKSGTSDSYGMIDMTFQQLEVTAKTTPIGPYPSDWINALGIQGAGAVRGRSRSATGANLYLSGTGIYAKLTQAALIDISPVRAGMATKRVGEVTFKSTMTLTGGAPNSPLQLSTAPIA